MSRPTAGSNVRTLLLMRHAKSDWDADYASDHERPLNDRGVRSAELMGRFLTGNHLAPLLIISSTAVRARTTAQLAARAGAWASPIQLDRRLYEGGPGEVLERAAQALELDRLMLVGHQPTWSLLVETLTGDRADVKTASVAVIEVAVDSWEQLPAVRGELVALHHPRALFDTAWDTSR